MRGRYLGQTDPANMFLVALNEKQRERLGRTCFRPQIPLAGNFLHWRHFDAVVDDQVVRKALSKHVAATTQEHGCLGTTFSCTIDVGRLIGWSSTAPLGEFTPDELVPFNLNRESVCLKVRKEANRLAKLTSLVTFVYHIQRRDLDGRWMAVVHSLYPGPDVGELQGDVSAREQVAFLDWENPGEPLPRISSFRGLPAQR